MAEITQGTTLAVSGSRGPLTPNGTKLVIAQLNFVVRTYKPSRIVTGACLGVDALAGRFGYMHSIPVHTVVPENLRWVDPEWEEYCTTHESVEGDYRKRNERMMELADWVVAFPERSSNGVDRGSGTWMTLRIAERRGIPVITYALDTVR
jgi:hypothetical protein